MYPKNAASPPFITVGQVVQISDGAVQTSGASARVKTGTGSWGASAGTLACDTTSGIWTYTPTQGETNADVWAVAVYKSACVGCDKTVVTTISATAGHAGLDWANMIGKTTTNALTGTTVADTQKVDVNTVKTQTVTCSGGVTVPAATLASTTNITAGTITTATDLTNLPSIPANWLTAAGISASALDGKGDWNIGKTGYSLSQSFPTNFASMSITAGGVVKADLDTIKTQTVTCAAGVTVLASVGTAATSTAQTGDSFARIGVDGAGLTAADDAVIAAIAALNNISTAQVNTECDTAIADAALATQASVDLVKAVTDALGATAAARLSLSANQIIPGTVDTVVNSHTPTTTEFQADDITEATADHYNGRIIIFTSGALAGQATSISDYVAVGGIGQFIVVALTEAPSDNDSFVIL